LALDVFRYLRDDDIPMPVLPRIEYVGLPATGWVAPASEPASRGLLQWRLEVLVARVRPTLQGSVHLETDS
jgi:hypothetical protein